MSFNDQTLNFLLQQTERVDAARGGPVGKTGEDSKVSCFTLSFSQYDSLILKGRNNTNKKNIFSWYRRSTAKVLTTNKQRLPRKLRGRKSMSRLPQQKTRYVLPSTVCRETSTTDKDTDCLDTPSDDTKSSIDNSTSTQVNHNVQDVSDQSCLDYVAVEWINIMKWLNPNMKKCLQSAIAYSDQSQDTAKKSDSPEHAQAEQVSMEVCPGNQIPENMQDILMDPSIISYVPYQWVLNRNMWPDPPEIRIPGSSKRGDFEEFPDLLQYTTNSAVMPSTKGVVIDTPNSDFVPVKWLNIMAWLDADMRKHLQPEFIQCPEVDDKTSLNTETQEQSAQIQSMQASIEQLGLVSKNTPMSLSLESCTNPSSPGVRGQDPRAMEELGNVEGATKLKALSDNEMYHAPVVQPDDDKTEIKEQPAEIEVIYTQDMDMNQSPLHQAPVILTPSRPTQPPVQREPRRQRFVQHSDTSQLPFSFVSPARVATSKSPVVDFYSKVRGKERLQMGVTKSDTVYRLDNKEVMTLSHGAFGPFPVYNKTYGMNKKDLRKQQFDAYNEY